MTLQLPTASGMPVLALLDFVLPLSSGQQGFGEKCPNIVIFKGYCYFFDQENLSGTFHWTTSQWFPYSTQSEDTTVEYWPEKEGLDLSFVLVLLNTAPFYPFMSSVSGTLSLKAH